MVIRTNSNRIPAGRCLSCAQGRIYHASRQHCVTSLPVHAAPVGHPSLSRRLKFKSSGATKKDL